MRYLKSTVLLLLIMISFTACNSNDEKNKNLTTTSKEIDKIVGVARIEPEKGLLYIYSTADGKIETLQADENSQVNEGSILANLDIKTDIAQLNQERSKISSQQSSIQSSEANAKAILSELQKAKADVLLNENLFEAKAIAEQTLKDSKAKASKLTFDYEKQLADVNLSKNKIKELDANLQYRNSVISEKQIEAPLAGKVLQWDIHKGDYVTAGQKLGQFAPDGDIIAITEVDELFVNKVKIGLKAKIVSQANGKKIGEGTVVFVAEFLKKKSLFSDENTVEDRRVKEVKIRLNKTTSAIINNRVDCIIYLK